MGFWDKLKTIFQPDEAKEFFVNQSLSPLDLGISTLPGIMVTEQSALSFSAVFAAVKILGESVSSLPLFLYRRLPGGGKEVAREHTLFPILHDLPNPEMTVCEFLELMMMYVLLWGNAYAEIERNAIGDVVALWPIHPARVRPRRLKPSAPLTFDVTLPLGAGRVTLSRSQVFHVRAFALDGVEGISPIRFHREAIALGIAAEQFGARFFGQGMQAGGVMEHPKTLSDEAHQRLKTSIRERQSGLEHAHRILILEEGMKFNKLSIPPDDAQWLQTRKHQILEVARIFNLQPHKLKDLDRATFSNIEEQNIDYVTDSLSPWLVRLEKVIARDLLTTAERADVFAQFKLEGLLRGKTTERFSAYAQARQWGWMSVNNILDLENRNPIGPAGDIFLSPMNMLSAEQALRMVQENPDMELEQDDGVDPEGRPRRRLTVRRRASFAIPVAAGNGDGG